MSTATDLVWTLAGRPEPFGAKAALLQDIPGTCAVTGHQEDRTADVNRALGENFTDRSMFHAPHSSRVGTAALWACSGKGNQTLRLWSIIAAPGVDLPASHEKAFLSAPGLWLGNRANPTPIVQTLTNPPAGEWLVSIAVSAQKHVLPYARVNHGPDTWTIRMENTDITATPTQWRTVHDTAVQLRARGVPSDAVRTGEPGLIRGRDDLAWWREASRPLLPYLESPLLDLALWTITKGTLNA